MPETAACAFAGKLKNLCKKIDEPTCKMLHLWPLWQRMIRPRKSRQRRYPSSWNAGPGRVAARWSVCSGGRYGQTWCWPWRCRRWLALSCGAWVNGEMAWLNFAFTVASILCIAAAYQAYVVLGDVRHSLLPNARTTRFTGDCLHRHDNRRLTHSARGESGPSLGRSGRNVRFVACTVGRLARTLFWRPQHAVDRHILCTADPLCLSWLGRG